MAILSGIPTAMVGWLLIRWRVKSLYIYALGGAGVGTLCAALLFGVPASRALVWLGGGIILSGAVGGAAAWLYLKRFARIF